MSTTEGGGNVVNDSLVILYDAANSKSFISGSTKWDNLSKFDYDGELKNSLGYNSNNFGSLTFNGVDEYVEIPKTDILSNKSTFTINSWVYPTSLTGLRPIFVNYYVANLQVMLRFSGSGLQFFTYTTTGVGGTTQSFTASNQWSNVVATYDGTTMKTYVNGVQSPTTYSQTGLLNVSTQPYLIGYYTSPTNYYFQGRVAYCGVYLRNLTDQEILQNYNAIKSRFGL
jgi:hypothetical protein